MPRISATAAALALLSALALAGACRVGDPPPITERWTDDFERESLGGDYRPTAGTYQLINGALSAKGARNHPLWLRKKLPRDVVIELDAWSTTPDGDVKVEIFGDGRSYDRTGGGQYTSSGYVLVMGGWNNSKSIIARGNEHGAEIAERREPRVEPKRRYRWKIVRQGERIDWFVDDMEAPFLSLTDPNPLSGPGHEYFAFNNWQSDSWFDNLTISPL